MTAMREAKGESDELFEMANLFPRTTGLAMTVWVNTTHGNQMNIANGDRRRPPDPTCHRGSFVAG